MVSRSKTKLRIRPEDRELFMPVLEAVFCNPFSAERRALNKRMAGTDITDDQALLTSVIKKVSERVDNLRKGRQINMGLYGAADRPLVKTLLLFDLFHRYLDAMDLLIVDQEKTGDAPCPVAFASDALKALIEGGFSETEAAHYFAFMYQMRRAYYFINHGLVGQSPSMEKLRCDLWNNIFTFDRHWYEDYLWNRMEDFSTILLGETGTGKGTAAAAIGRSGYIPFDPAGSRFAHSFTSGFISINLSQFPESLIESELFGHTKGAFTGAVEAHQGIFSRCRPHGTIFLDEIGDVTIPVQIKLLKVIQERTFTMVGSHKEYEFRGRVVAATNKSLDQMRTAGVFRDDFYYRLCSDVIEVPSLRRQISENPACLKEILSHTLQRIIGRPSTELENIVISTLNQRVGPDYPWPGNVRELEQAVRRILLQRSYAGDRKLQTASSVDLLLQGIEQGDFTAQALLGSYCTMLYERFGTYEQVARVTGLDRRTVKKYVDAGQRANG